MTKQTIAAAVLSIGALIVTSSAKASLILYASGSTPDFQSTDSYDFSGPGNFPPTTYQNIGTFIFAPITDTAVSSITISGSFGNFSYNLTTPLSDYYLGDAGDGEEAVEVAACDYSGTGLLPNCFAGQEGPYDWSATLNATQIANLADGLASGSIDFGYTWDHNTPATPDQAFGDSNGYDALNVEAGATTFDIYTAPEPATFLFCFSGIAGLAILRRFRKV